MTNQTQTRRQFFGSASTLVAAGATSIVTASTCAASALEVEQSPEERIEHHTKALEAALRDFYGSQASVYSTFNGRNRDCLMNGEISCLMILAKLTFDEA